MSIGSVGSIASIGSAGSILSIGSAGSILSIGSAGSILSVGSAGAILSSDASGSILRDGRDRMEGGALARHLAVLAVSGVVIGCVTAGAARLVRR